MTNHHHTRPHTTVYVSSDQDKGAAGTAQQEHGWDLAVPFEDKALRSKLKGRFKVWAMVESGEFGQVCTYVCMYTRRGRDGWVNALCWFVEGSTREIGTPILT